MVLDAEAVVGGYGYAVFAGHGDYCCSVVFEDGHFLFIYIEKKKWLVAVKVCVLINCRSMISS